MYEKKCACTGHRPKKFPWGYDETDSRCVALKKALTEQIIKLADSGYTDFLSGMAEGADTWAALAVLDLKKENPALKLHCVLPCEGQADLWLASAQEIYYIYSGVSGRCRIRGPGVQQGLYAQTQPVSGRSRRLSAGRL